MAASSRPPSLESDYVSPRTKREIETAGHPGGIDSGEPAEHFSGTGRDLQHSGSIGDARQGEGDLMGFFVEQERGQWIDARNQIVDPAGGAREAVKSVPVDPDHDANPVRPRGRNPMDASARVASG